MNPPVKQTDERTRGHSPIYSMTGFARVAGRVDDTSGWTLTIKGVNHRFLDLHMRMPSGTEALEMQLRRRLKDELVRGHLEVTLTVERSMTEQVQVDRELVSRYVAALRAIAHEHGLKQEPDANVILRMPGVFGAHGTQSAGRTAEERAGEGEALERSVLAELPSLLLGFNQMRAIEGQALADELVRILDRLLRCVHDVEAMHAEVQQTHAERTRDRIVAILGRAVDRERLLQEAAILAERSDVMEEIARLKAHVAHFRSYLDSGGELGKKLDFLLQEMNREANTLLSKTAGVAAEGTRVTELGLAIKAEVEKAREQVQNLE
ncbi:MAG: YicC/YloC family endoribonuclease [Acidobacteriaceae bacterium]